ncbi:MliC family protein [Moraxella oblonga]|uniref:MliC family protein n=1 Tax=Moraxella oblonga TaxID=200413 RepID=UPI000836A77E|nr:MliC family protein [Moraxella oblonga]
MKKLLIATGIVSALAMTGCATTAHTPADDHAHEYGHQHTHEYEHNHDYHSKPKHHKEGDSFTATYECGAGAKVTALYDPEAESSILTITAPKLNLNNAEITAQLAPSGSGMRFVSHVSSDTSYDWHTKGTFGMLEVTINGKAHTLECYGSIPMHDH